MAKYIGENRPIAEYIEEAKRYEMNEREADLSALSRVLDYDLPEATRAAFDAMLADMVLEVPFRRGETYRSVPLYERECLTSAQGRWVRSELEKWEPPVTRLTSGPVPRGREVPVPEVLRTLPKRPPGR